MSPYSLEMRNTTSPKTASPLKSGNSSLPSKTSPLKKLSLSLKKTPPGSVCKEVEFSTTTLRKTGGLELKVPKTCPKANQADPALKFSMNSNRLNIILNTANFAIPTAIVADSPNSGTQSSCHTLKPKELLKSCPGEMLT